MPKRVVIEGRIVTHFRENVAGPVANAVKKFRAETPDAEIQYVNDQAFLGLCEVCGDPLMENSKYYCDQEGTRWCKKHGLCDE